MNGTDPTTIAAVPKRLRRLKWNELVRSGDFVENSGHGFEPWFGPAGFRADAFIKTIYRKLSHQPAIRRKAL
jgi:hypothetical protein